MNKNMIKQLLVLQIAVLLYTGAGITGKFASAEKFFSLHFFLLYGLEIVFLGFYAIIWQQVIQRIDLSIAYANRSMNLIWTMLFAVIIFHETITIGNIIGVILVILGIFLVNGTENQTGKKVAK